MLLIAYDGSADARAAVQHAAELFPGDRVTVLTVWTPFAEVIARSGAGAGLAPGLIDYEEIDEASEKSATERAAEGVELAKQAGLDSEPRVAAQRTTTAEAILHEARGVDARVIVVGSRGLTGIKSFLLGSVSHAVLHHADRPVVVITSDDVIRERDARGD
jgi:nucleotide-binding universal stress UspA family protein